MGVPLPPPAARGLFGVPSFRRLFGAQTVSRWGDTFNQVALVILVFELTGSGLRVAGTVAFEVVPVILLAPVAGAVADRLPKRRVMIAADLARAALMLVLVAGPHHLALVYAAAFGLAAGSVFFNPAASALLPALVEEGRLVSANSVLWTAAVVSQIALAPAAGLLVASLGARSAFAVNGASFLLSALLLRGVPPDAPSPDRGRWRTQILEGATLVRRHALVRLLATVQLLASLSAGATSALLIVLAGRRLGLGPSGFGLLLSAIGVGAAAGPLLLRAAGRRSASLPWLFGAYALRGAVDLVLAATRQPAVAAGALAAYGIGTSGGTVMYQTTMQSRLPASIRGRAFAILDVVWQSGRLASLAAGGIVADAAGVQAVYVLGGALLLAAAAAGLAGSRRVRL